MINYLLSILVIGLLLERVYFYYKKNETENKDDNFSLQHCKNKQRTIERENIQIKEQNRKIKNELERVRANHGSLHKAMLNLVENNKVLLDENRKLMKTVDSLLTKTRKMECFLNILLGNDWEEINPESINSDKLRKIIKNFMENKNDNINHIT